MELVRNPPEDNEANLDILVGICPRRNYAVSAENDRALIIELIAERYFGTEFEHEWSDGIVKFYRLNISVPVHALEEPVDLSGGYLEEVID